MLEKRARKQEAGSEQGLSDKKGRIGPHRASLQDKKGRIAPKCDAREERNGKREKESRENIHDTERVIL